MLLSSPHNIIIWIHKSYHPIFQWLIFIGFKHRPYCESRLTSYLTFPLGYNEVVLRAPQLSTMGKYLFVSFCLYSLVILINGRCPPTVKSRPSILRLSPIDEAAEVGREGRGAVTGFHLSLICLFGSPKKKHLSLDLSLVIDEGGPFRA